MPSFTIKETIPAPVSAVWPSWDSFTEIDQFHFGLKHSEGLPGKDASGRHAERMCTMKDGKNWIKERVINWEKNEKLVIEIYDTSFPVKSATACIFFKEEKGHTHITFNMDFETKGVLGKLMQPMMGMQFKKLLTSVLHENKNLVLKQFKPAAI